MDVSESCKWRWVVWCLNRHSLFFYCHRLSCWVVSIRTYVWEICRSTLLEPLKNRVVRARLVTIGMLCSYECPSLSRFCARALELTDEACCVLSVFFSPVLDSGLLPMYAFTLNAEESVEFIPDYPYSTHSLGTWSLRISISLVIVDRPCLIRLRVLVARSSAILSIWIRQDKFKITFEPLWCDLCASSSCAYHESLAMWIVW